MTAALELHALCKRFGGLTVTNNVTLEIVPAEIHAIIGPNGAGKTTLINQITGLIAVDSGRIVLNGEDITSLSMHERAAKGIARSFQITSVLATFSALENVALAVQARTGSSFRFFARASKETAVNAAAMAALDEVGLGPRAGDVAGELSHGEKRALELAIALAMQPAVLLLDEPLAGTGREEGARLVELLTRLKGRFPIVLVEHDMEAVFALADRVSVLTYGSVLASGLPQAVRADPQVIAAYLGSDPGAFDA